MPKAADWYFDFISPYSYLQCERLLELPVAIQNAPEYIGVGLSDGSLMELARSRPNFVLLKGEGPALAMVVGRLSDRNRATALHASRTNGGEREAV